MSTTGVEPHGPAPVARRARRDRWRGVPRRGRATRGGGRLPALVLPAGRDHLRRDLHRPDAPVVLLQPDPVDAVHDRVHRARQLRPVLPRAGADERRAEHDRLRRRDERPQGRHRAAAGDAPDLAPAHSQPAAVDHLLPGPGQHRRRRHHVRRPDASLGRPHQPVARGHRDRWAAVALEPEHRAAVGRLRRRLEGRRHRARDLHRRDPVDPRGVLRGGPARGRRLGASSGTSSCRSAGTRRSR